MKRYVLGFLFPRSLDSVLLIEKNRPEWQAGLKNGIGGKVENGETWEAAMQREFLEETGADVSDWTPFLYLKGLEWTVRCFWSVGDPEVKTMTDEKLVSTIFPLRPWDKVIPNLHWLVPMARDAIRGDWGLDGSVILNHR